jgi:hypothetical protein
MDALQFGQLIFAFGRAAFWRRAVIVRHTGGIPHRY